MFKVEMVLVLVQGGVEGDVEGGDGVGVSAGGVEGDVKGGDGVAKAGHSKTFKPSYRDSKSKNKRRPCSYCGFFGVHLKQHFQSVHGDKVTSKEDQMRLSTERMSRIERREGRRPQLPTHMNTSTSMASLAAKR